MSIKTTELLSTTCSWDGVKLPDYPTNKPELKVCRMVFPCGAKTGWHHHNVINYGIVEQGELTIVCQEGKERTFHKGEALVEVVGTIHRGENRGSEPVILDMFYVSSPDTEVTTQHPEIVSASFERPAASSTQALNPTNKEEERVFKLILTVGTQTVSRRYILASLGMKQNSRHTFINNYLKPAMKKGLVAFAFPGFPNKPEQAYRLTANGTDLYKQLTGEDII